MSFGVTVGMGRPSFTAAPKNDSGFKAWLGIRKQVMETIAEIFIHGPRVARPLSRLSMHELRVSGLLGHEVLSGCGVLGVGVYGLSLFWSSQGVEEFLYSTVQGYVDLSLHGKALHPLRSGLSKNRDAWCQLPQGCPHL